jgi:hypothetical protein
MGWYQTIHGSLTCPVCGNQAPAEADLPIPLPPDDEPEYLAVGDPLAPFGVSNYDPALLQLRERQHRERGAVILMWTCFRCLADRWALARLAEVEGVDRLISFEACPIAPESLERADWIHAAIVADLVRGTAYESRIPLQGRLTDAERELLKQCVANHLSGSR